MPIFQVTTKEQSNDEAIGSRIKEHFPNEHYEIGRGGWLVVFGGTSKELYNKLFPEEELTLPSNDVIIVGVSGYWGITSPDMWEWIKVKQAPKSG